MTNVPDGPGIRNRSVFSPLPQALGGRKYLG